MLGSSRVRRSRGDSQPVAGANVYEATYRDLVFGSAKFEIMVAKSDFVWSPKLLSGQLFNSWIFIVLYRVERRTR